MFSMYKREETRSGISSEALNTFETTKKVSYFWCQKELRHISQKYV